MAKFSGVSLGTGAYLDKLILDNAIVDSNGHSDVFSIRGADHLDVLIRVGDFHGWSGYIKFFLDIVEASSGEVIRTYDGSVLYDPGNVSDWITVDNLILGTHAQIRWFSAAYFAGVYCRVVAKILPVSNLNVTVVQPQHEE